MKKNKVRIAIIAILMCAVTFVPKVNATQTINCRPGNGTIKNALSQAEPGDTIFLNEEGSYSGEKIVIDKDIKIVGKNMSKTYVSTIFEIDGAENVTFENLTLNGGGTIRDQKLDIINVKKKTNLNVNNVVMVYATRGDSQGKFSADVKNIHLDKESSGSVVNIKGSVLNAFYNCLIVDSSENTITVDNSNLGGNVAIELNNGTSNNIYIKNNSIVSGRSPFLADSEEAISIIGQQDLLIEVTDSKLQGQAIADRIYDEEGNLLPNKQEIPAHIISFDDETSDNVQINIKGNSQIEDLDEKGESNIFNFGQMTPDKNVSVFVENTVKLIPSEIVEKYNEPEDYVVVGIKDYKGDWTIKPYAKNVVLPSEVIPKNDVLGYKLNGIMYKTTAEDGVQDSEEKEFIETMNISQNTDIIPNYEKILNITIDGTDTVFYLDNNETFAKLKEQEEALAALEKLKNTGDPKKLFSNYVVSYTDDEGNEHTDKITDDNDTYSFTKDATISADYKDLVKVTLKVDDNTRITTYIEKGQTLAQLSEEAVRQFEEALRSDVKRVKENGYVELVNDEEIDIPLDRQINEDITIVAKYEVDVTINGQKYTIDEGETLQTLSEELAQYKTAEQKDFKNFVKVVEDIEKEVIEEDIPITEHITLKPKYTVNVTISGQEYVMDEGSSLSLLSDENVEVKNVLNDIKNVENKNFKNFVNEQDEIVGEYDAIVKHTQITPKYYVVITIENETFEIDENMSLSSLNEENKARLNNLKTDRFSRFVDAQGNTVDENKTFDVNTTLYIKNNVKITIDETEFNLEEGKTLSDLNQEDKERLNEIKQNHENYKYFSGFRKQGEAELIDEEETTFETDTTLEAVYEILKGDINKDGFINSTDAAMVLDRYKDGNQTEEDILIADMDENEILNSTDAAMILDIYKEFQNGN